MTDDIHLAIIEYMILINNVINGASKTDWVAFATLVTALLSFVVAVAAIYFPIRRGLYHIIISQLFEKAQESNGYLIANYKFPNGNFGAMVGIYSAIIAGQQLLDFNCTGFRNKFLLIFANKQSFIDQFYLYLHTSIKCNIGNCINEIRIRNARLPENDVLIKEKPDIEKLRDIRYKTKEKSDHEITDILNDRNDRLGEFKEKYLHCIFEAIGLDKDAAFYDKLSLLIQILDTYYFFEKSIKRYE